jgi:hypothetical protein
VRAIKPQSFGNEAASVAMRKKETVDLKTESESALLQQQRRERNNELFSVNKYYKISNSTTSSLLFPEFPMHIEKKCTSFHSHQRVKRSHTQNMFCQPVNKAKRGRITRNDLLAEGN